jgi:L-lactate dehydrogenase complex protein LldE
MRVSLFVPCFNDALFPGTAVATVRLLRRLGHEVDFPRDQTCCGQIHFNTGYRTEARRLALRFLRVFEGAEVVVAPSASCVAMVREQYRELLGEGGEDRRGDGPGGADRRNPEPGSAPGTEATGALGALASRTYELTEFLVGVLGVEDVGAVFPHRVALHPTCHSIRGIQVGDAPLRLLRAVRGLELLDLPNAEACCGFGGTFSVKNPHTSLAMMDDKIRDVVESGAEVLTAVDNSCLMHLAGGLHRKGLLEEGLPVEGSPVEDRRAGRDKGNVARPGLRLMHLAEILVAGEGEEFEHGGRRPGAGGGRP